MALWGAGFCPLHPPTEPKRHWLSLPLWHPAGGRGACPARHWLALPRGRGPSQTPPSLATDSSISPGPPSPWLPALPIERQFYRLYAEPLVSLSPVVYPAKRVPGVGLCPLRGGGGWRSGTRRGACFLCRPPAFYFSLIFCPHPPDPLPAGKGEIKVIFMQGAKPLASPGLNPGGTYRTCRCVSR